MKVKIRCVYVYACLCACVRMLACVYVMSEVEVRGNALEGCMRSLFFQLCASTSTQS